MTVIQRGVAIRHLAFLFYIRKYRQISKNMLIDVYKRLIESSEKVCICGLF